MKKLLAVVLIVVCGLIGMKIAYAAMEIEKINVDFSNQDATAYFEQGNFGVSNSILVNGDKVEVNAFVPDGAQTSVEIKGSAFQQVFGGLIQAQALNMDAVTNATIGQTGVFIASADENQMNEWANGTY